MATENRTPDDLQEAVAATLRRLRGEVRNPPPAAAERTEPRLTQPGLTAPGAEEPAPLLTSEQALTEPDLLTRAEPEIPLAPTERSAMPEGLAAYREDAARSRSRLIPYALSFAALVVFAGIVWWAYQAIMAGHKGGPVPVITADTTPAKIPPADQTSTDTPAQQQTVYDQISGTNTQPKSEVLLPAPETPQTPPPPPAPVPSATDVAGTATDAGSTATTGAAITTPPATTTQTLIPPPAPLAPAPTGTTTDTTQPATTADAGSSGSATTADQATAGQTTVGQTTTNQADTGQTTTGGSTDTGAASTAATEPAPYEVPTLAPMETQMGNSTTLASAGSTSNDTTAAATSSTTSQTSGAADNFRIQVAALKTEAEANTAWKRILAKHSDVLGSLSVHIVKADLGGQGIYYRVQAGPFADKASAAAACDQLKTAGQQCLVKP
jgi:hypothetical protein